MTALNRPLSQFEAAALGVNTKANKASPGVRGRSVGGEIDAPAFESARTFLFQSYFDTTLLQKAILAQASNEPIVQSTLSNAQQVSGYGVALHPSSECPVAIQFFSGSQQGGSQVYRLKPGQVIRPFGQMNGQPGSFSGFQWGLPFGWLGGGSATLIVLRTPDAEVFWTGNPEIIFHRQRMRIYAPAALPNLATTPFYNWPKRFPWAQAQFGTNSLRQSGQPGLAVTPTRTAMRLNLIPLAATNDVRLMFCGSNDFAEDANGAVVLTDLACVDMTWGTNAMIVGSVNLVNQFPTQMLTGQVERFAADNGAMVMLDVTGGLSGGAEPVTVDVVRYGHL